MWSFVISFCITTKLKCQGRHREILLVGLYGANLLSVGRIKHYCTTSVNNYIFTSKFLNVFGAYNSSSFMLNAYAFLCLLVQQAN